MVSFNIALRESEFIFQSFPALENPDRFGAIILDHISLREY